MVLWRVERREVVEVVLDLRPVGDVEAEGGEERLDALQRERERMQAAAAGTATGQRDVERIRAELPGELRVGERRASRFECGFEPGLRVVDPGAGLAAR